MSTKAQQIREEEISTGDAELPEGWAEAKVADLADAIQYGHTASAIQDSTGPRFLRITDIQNGIVDWNLVPTCSITESDLAAYRLRAGDIVFARTGATTGKSFLISSCPEAVFASYLIRIRPVALINPAFIWLFFQTRQYWQFISENVAGNAQPGCNATKLAALPVLLPPVNEQDRIAVEVERLRAIQRTIEKCLKKTAALLDRFRQAVLVAACSGKLTEDWRKGRTEIETAVVLLERILAERTERHEDKCRKSKSQQRPVPKRPMNLKRSAVADGIFELPDSWEWVTWNDLVDWVTYGFTRPMPHVDHGVPIVTAKNISDSCINFDKTDLTTRDAFNELSEKDRPHQGEILLTKDGSIGRAAIVERDQPFCINQSVALLRFGGLTAYPPYLLRAIECKYTQDLIQEQAKGTAIPHISITAFGSFPLPLPPLEEQKEIVRRVEALFTLADAIEKRVAAASTRAENLMQAILAKAFRGELVPTEAELARRKGRSYEPASVLLERIKAEKEKTHESKSNRKARAANAKA